MLISYWNFVINGMRDDIMKFFVTYCTMDGQLANPFWHACLILSYWPGEGQKIEVKNAWGFYAASMSSPDSMVGKVKRKMGLGFDFQGNHGLLKKEEMRFLDLGYGLRGVTFDISLEQFLQLKQKCNNILVMQDLAIAEAKQRLSSETREPNSIEIFQEEKRQASLEHRSPRLQPFDFQLSLGMGGGLSLGNSHTCKTMAIKLLLDIGIAQEHLDGLTQYNTSLALPRMSGQQEMFFLHSTGPRQKHESQRTGKVSFFRTWQDKGTQLFWSLPPQLLITKSAILKNMLTLPGKYVDPVKKILRKLQEIETTVVNTKLTDENESYRLRLINRICDLYNAFAVISSKLSEGEIEEKIAVANHFFNSIYFAINDEWEDSREVETIAAKIPEDDQQKICKILGRSMAKSSFSPVMY